MRQCIYVGSIEGKKAVTVVENRKTTKEVEVPDFIKRWQAGKRATKRREVK